MYGSLIHLFHENDWSFLSNELMVFKRLQPKHLVAEQIILSVVFESL